MQRDDCWAFMSYAHVIFTFCPPQVHQQEHHPQNPRVDDPSRRASSCVSVRMFVMPGNTPCHRVCVECDMSILILDKVLIERNHKHLAA